jgi:hypothetical protein
LFDAGACAVWRGYIDGPVRVIRLIQGSASGAATTKYEFAYPGELHQRVHLRADETLGGPIYSYPDLWEENVSDQATDDTAQQPVGEVVSYVYEADDESGGAPYLLDKVNGVGAPDKTEFGYRDWYQVNTPIGSFLTLAGDIKLPGNPTKSADYWDSDIPKWNDAAQAIERDSEDGDYGAAHWDTGSLPETWSCDCKAQDVDDKVATFERAYVVLSAGEADRDGDMGAQEASNRQSAFSVSVEEEQYSGLPGPPDPPIEPCKPVLQPEYGDDGAEVLAEVDLGGCPNAIGWNLYRSLGAGLSYRLASLPPSGVYRDWSLGLDEEATYYAAALGPGGTEGEFSDPVTIQHVDTVPPEAPIDVEAAVEPGTVTVSWLPPSDPGLAAYKIRVATASGGPYTLAAEGAQLWSSNRVEITVLAQGGETYYFVVVLRDHAGNEGPPSAEVSVEVP